MPCATCRSSPKSLKGSARCCLATALAFTFYSGNCVPPPFLWTGATVGWVGAPKLFQISASSRDAAHAASGAHKALHWNLLSVVPHARGVVENLFSTASGPVSTVLRSRSGAAFCCWLGTWFHTTLLCCNVWKRLRKVPPPVPETDK